ncbi:MAG: hypothetical protein IIC50_11920 [Planctomycetes bacterium]|nr:hypothetical protein [Planctomycetota bacterium]
MSLPKALTWQRGVVAGILGLLLVTGSALRFSRAAASKPSGALPGAPVTRPPVTQPTIIWFHSVSSNPLESLELALASGLITDVLMLYMHRFDADWQTSDKAQQAIRLVKASPARLIWCRDLWPYYDLRGVKPMDIYDPNYYLREIRHLRSEAEAMGADAVALDIEPYGASPMKQVFKSAKGRAAVKRPALRETIRRVLEQAEKVDYLLPGGSTEKSHPYNILSALGENRIAESTYYNRLARLKRVHYPFEIFGAYVNVQSYNPRSPTLPFFRVSDLFELSGMWSHRKGVFLYTDGKSATATAQTLNDYVQQVVMKRAQPDAAHGTVPTRQRNREDR